MYWIYLILFIVAVLVPDVVRDEFYFLSEESLEELLIFLLGMAGFLIFVFKEHQLSLQKIEQEKNQKRLHQTAKDLVESYSYIGEVNRKMDLMMQIALGLADQSVMNKNKEKEIYFSIINTSNFLMKADCALLRFVNVKNKNVEKEIKMDDCICTIKNSELAEMEDNVNIKKKDKFLVVSSHQLINGVRSFVIINGFNELEEKNQNNIEILKFLSSQALFLYSYMAKTKK